MKIFDSQLKTVIFTQYIALFFYFFGISAYISAALGIYLLICVALKIVKGEWKIKKNIIKYLLIVLGVIFVNFIIALSYGTNLRASMQNIYPLLFVLFIVILMDNKIEYKTETIFILLSNLVIISSAANIYMTLIGLIKGEVQEGYRYLLIQIICCGPLMLYYFWSYKRRWNYLLAGVLSVVAIVVSYSKQAYASLAFILFICILIASFGIKRKIKLILVIGAGLFFMLWVFLPFAHSVKGLNTIAEAFEFNLDILKNYDKLLAQETYRLTENKSAMEKISEHLLWGIGSGTKYTEFGLKTWVHNAWLWMLLDFGMVGFVIFLMPVIMAIKKVLKKIRNTAFSDFEKKYLYVFLLSCILLIFINGIASPIFFRGSSEMAFFGIIIALSLKDRSYE